MKTQFNLTTNACDLDRFSDRSDLLELMEGFDGVELLCTEEDMRHLVPEERVTGLHMVCYPYWLDFYNGDMDACIAEYGSREVCLDYYGGDTREALFDHYRKDLANAKRYGAEYMVFHVSDCTLAEAMTGKYRHSDEEVIDASCEFLNELFPADAQDYPMLLLENLWEAGHTFTEPAKTERLLDKIAYPKKGLMLDTGHLMHTNLDLASQEEAVAYIHRMLDAHGQLCDYIHGIHLNQSITGSYIRRIQNNPPVLAPTYAERFGQMFEYVFKVDLHQPFTCPQVKGIVERIAPDYLTFEFISDDLEQHRGMLAAQWRALRGR